MGLSEKRKIDRVLSHGLSPYEKARLRVLEAAGRRRRRTMEAICSCATARDAYWTERWSGAIFMTAAYAFHAALLGLAGKPESADHSRARAWLGALLRLEAETGAPFTKCESFLPGGSLLDAVPSAPGSAASPEYQALRNIWSAVCDEAPLEDRLKAAPHQTGETMAGHFSSREPGERKRS